jgi:hypothetical protein
MSGTPVWPRPSMAQNLGLTEPRKVRCSCGVRVWAIDLVDVSPLPGAVRGDARYWCGGCRERAFADGRITREGYLLAMGAPAAMVAESAAEDAAQVAASGDAGA